jgi:translocation and assembly module TamB
VAAARLSSPVDLDLRATYDGLDAKVEVRGQSAGREVLSLAAEARAKAADVISRDPALAWTASGAAHVENFPLASVGALDDRQIRGHLSGDVRVDDLHHDGSARAGLSVTGLKVGDVAYSVATVALNADGKSVNADLRVEGDSGFLAAKATVPARWGTALLPVADPNGTLGLDLQAKHFRAAVILPFLRSVLDELDGVIDADLHAKVDPRTSAVHVQGSAEVHDGLVEVGAFGGELHDIAAKVTLTPAGVLTLEQLTAHGISGEALVSGTARLDGLRLEAANATVLIPKAQALPLSVGGALLGNVDGKIDLSEALSADRRTVEVKVDVPTLHLVAPEAGSQDVQALGPIPRLAVGVRKTVDGPFIEGAGDAEQEHTSSPSSVAARSGDAVAVHVVTRLGSDVTLKRGTDVRVELGGGPIITVTDKAHVSGQIQLKGGALNLYGKKFDIERGTVSFVGDDPSDPQVNVTAGWTASDGTRVYAEFLGPLKTGKVTLRSEPPLGKNDIVQLLLFGTIESGQAAAAQGGVPGASSAGGVAGSVAAQPINRALDQFGLSAVSANVDTSTVNPKPEITVQVAKDISLQLARILYIGPPPPGTSPDTTLLTIDWRFLAKWSLDGTVGNAGTTIVDLVWKYRY